MGYLLTTPDPTDETALLSVEEWYVDVDTPVYAGDPIVEIASETGQTTLRAREDGILRAAFLDAGQSCPPGTPIGVIEAADEDLTGLLESREDSDTSGSVTTDSAVDSAETTAVTDTERTPRGLPERSVLAQLEADLSGRISAGTTEWYFDVSKEFGGGGGPTPVDYFIGALAACLASSIGIQADIRDVELDTLSVSVDAEPAEGSVNSLSAQVTLEGDVDDDTLDRIVTFGERTCHVAELLREDLAFDISWSRP